MKHSHFTENCWFRGLMCRGIKWAYEWRTLVSPTSTDDQLLNKISDESDHSQYRRQRWKETTRHKQFPSRSTQIRPVSPELFALWMDVLPRYPSACEHRSWVTRRVLFQFYVEPRGRSGTIGEISMKIRIESKYFGAPTRRVDKDARAASRE